MSDKIILTCDWTLVNLKMPVRIAVLTHCQMNENPCSNQEIHVLFEHGFKLENTSNEPRVIYKKPCGPD